MALTNYTMGSLIEMTTEINDSLQYGPDDVMGMTITKEIIPTKAKVSTTDLSHFLVVHPNEFIYNPRTHGKHIGFGFNNTGKSFVISWNNIAFRIKPAMQDIILADYLFLHFNRDEWDREACYRSWGSSTEVFSWDALCEMKLQLPDLPTQEKYVAIYKAIQANQQSYERGLEDLRLVCEGYIDKLKACLPLERIGEYIALSEERNDEGKYTLDDVRGVSIEKRFIETKANMQGVNLKPYYVVRPDAFAFVTVTSRNGEKISLAHNSSNDTYICSSSYVVFTCTDKEKLLPRYLRLFFERSEFDRYARFNSWGSARETFDFSDMQDVRIPIPDIDVQTALADLFDVYLNRRAINERLKAQLNAMCPILIRGSLSDGG